MVRFYEVALIGSTGIGKSTFGNHLVGREKFPVSRGLKQRTTTIGRDQGTHGEISLEVIDVPDYVNIGSHPDRLEMEPPDAVLLMVRCDTSFTVEDYQQAHALLSMIPSGSCDLLVLVFTRMTEDVKTCFDQYLGEAGPYLQQLYDEAGQRCMFFSPGNDSVSLAGELAALVERLRRSAVRKKMLFCGLVLWSLVCLYYREVSFKTQAIWYLPVPKRGYWYFAAAAAPQSSYWYFAAAAICPWLIWYRKVIKYRLGWCFGKVKSAFWSLVWAQIQRRE